MLKPFLSGKKMINSRSALFIFFFAALFWLPLSAIAQCGMGIPGAGNPGCIPPDVLNQQNNTSQQQPRTVIIRHKWADRWGAISADGVAGSLGFVTGFPNKRSAERAAVKECKDGGGAIVRLKWLSIISVQLSL